MVDQDVMKGPQQQSKSAENHQQQQQQQQQCKPSPKSGGDHHQNHQDGGKLSRVKRILTGCAFYCNGPSTFDEAKAASCKARKRKERQESVSSISQERKVIRSNSEERPLPSSEDFERPLLKTDIRRVSSHENFQTPQPPLETGPSVVPAAPVTAEECKNARNKSPLRDHGICRGNGALIYDDCEHERRRSYERFSRPLLHKTRRSAGGSRRPKTKRFNGGGKSSKQQKTGGDFCDNNNTSDKNEESSKKNLLALNEESAKGGDGGKKERSPSPIKSPISPPLDLSTLHEQIDCSEPVPSNSNQPIGDETETLPSLSVASNRLLSSPRNSIMITRRIYLDPDVPLSNVALSKESKNPLEQRLRQLVKQMNRLKKKIKKQEEEFEAQFGFKPSHADKLCDKTVKKLYTDLGKLKKEHKLLKEEDYDGHQGATADDLKENNAASVGKQAVIAIHDTLKDIEKHLEMKRKTAERCSELQKMTNEQLSEEKIAIQKALLHLESIHGRPSSKEDRDLVRPFYDRYRTLKRMMAKISMSQSTSNELATIHEHETMDFVSTSPPATTTMTTLTTTMSEIEQEGSISAAVSTDSDTDTSIGENLHSLSREELLEQQKIITEEKKQLRRTLRQFELEFQTKNGRKLQKEDRIPMENVYSVYKKTKAKLRLIDALLGKQTR